ncbi:MAG: ketopantoate reductase family protein [Methanobrevibacter sp.]|uniref:ketopantoate reductase family protein n=1 Tax=Methanobrevibacter sp. TaxID=66852 RepID=UPI0025CE69F4|nr:ketopantoate reductase family protein [Methanobrevibacter sp.]MBR0272292.1 ketopantoate reductase family protein [Methanobrevibacter sp.]
MKILIIGSGSVGIGLGASLLSQKSDVSFLARDRTASEMKTKGIKRTGLFTHYSFGPDEFKVYESYDEMPENEFDFVLVASKTTANANIAEMLDKHRQILKDDFTILICQNGFGNDEPYINYFRTDEVYCARIITGFTRPERNISEVTVYTEPILLGSLQNEDISHLQIIADKITASGINCELTDELDKYLWAKMLYNCTLNPLGAILDVTYGKLTENQYSKGLMDSIIDEIFNVITASPYTTLWDNSDDYRKVFYEKLVPDTYNHYSSTHQDIKRKIKTEIDTLNGKVIELGEKYNIDVGTNKIIYDLIKAIESDFSD